jgi:hypothetical protein
MISKANWKRTAISKWMDIHLSVEKGVEKRLDSPDFLGNERATSEDRDLRADPSYSKIIATCIDMSSSILWSSRILLLYLRKAHTVVARIHRQKGEVVK